MVTSGLMAGMADKVAPVKGTLNGFDRRARHATQIRIDILAHQPERQAARPRLIGHRHLSVRVLDVSQRRRPRGRDRIPKPVQRPNTGITRPGERHPTRAPHADHMVIDQIRGHADEMQIAPALADHFVAGCEWNEMSKAFHGHTLAIVHMALNRCGQA